MRQSNKTYTYRNGKKIELEKNLEQMVVRALPNAVSDEVITEKEQVSSASTRVTTSANELESMMSRSRMLAPTHHAYFETEQGNEFLITDRIFVTFKEALSDEQVDAFSAHYALVEKEMYNAKDYLFQLTNQTNMNPVKLVVKLVEEEALVEMAGHDLNQRMNSYDVEVPEDPRYVGQWHLHTNFNHPYYDPRSSTRCEDAWNLLDSYGSEEVVVAVTDDGCKLNHSDFNSPNKFADWGYMSRERLLSKSDIDSDPDKMYKQGSNHGTSCCGVIAGEVDTSFTVGAAPDCRLLPIQWESSGRSLYISDSKLLTVLNYIADKVDVMSNSWGSSPTYTWESLVINRIKALSQTGGRRGTGIVFLWAAGNENCLIDYRSDQKVPYDSGWKQKLDGSWEWKGVKTAKVFQHNLSDIPGVMHIAALASTAKRSHYSNYGPSISLSAPSSNSHKYGRMRVKGLGITTTTGKPGGVTSIFGGTSSATPLVAGVAALVISANPKLRAHEVIEILKRTASKDLNFTGYAKTQPASFNSDVSWDISPIAPFDSGDFQDIGSEDGSWSPWFGHGRVDAADAVAEVQRLLGNKSGKVKFQGSSSPDRSIPDKNTQGIKDKINCNKTFKIQSIKVHLDILHTYIGDLIVLLISPAGKSIKLHNRNGGSTSDIHTDYDNSSIPQFIHLLGGQTQGEWTLHVQDLAAQDRGRLQNWSLELTGEEETVIYVEENPGIIIPDDVANGIERFLNVSQNGQLREIEVEVDITHTYIGDIRIALISPNGTKVMLHNRTGGSADNIIKTYTMTNTSILQTLQGEEINGVWKLKVSDHAGVDQGKLNHWALKITPV